MVSAKKPNAPEHHQNRTKSNDFNWCFALGKRESPKKHDFQPPVWNCKFSLHVALKKKKERTRAKTEKKREMNPPISKIPRRDRSELPEGNSPVQSLVVSPH
jgi:hypothetical protein